MFLVLLLFLLLLGNLVTSFLFRPPAARPFGLSSKTSDVLDFFAEIECIDKQMALRYLKDQLKSKDELLASEDKAHQDLKEAHQDLQEAHQDLKSIYQKLFDAQEVEIRSLRLECFRSKGLMTARGVFEFFLNWCYAELKRFHPQTLNGIHRFSARSTVGAIEELGDLLSPLATSCRSLWKFKKDGGFGTKSLYDVYAVLSDKIHGDSWHGESVKVFKNSLEQHQVCLITKVAEILGLPVDIDDDE